LRFPLRFLIALTILLAVSLMVACGEGGEEEEATREESPQAAAATATAAPEEETAEVTSAPAEAFAKLQSYRIGLRFTLGGTAAEEAGTLAMDLEGSFVAPDRSQARVTARLGDLEMEEEFVTIGNQSWVKAGDNWVEGKPQFELGDLSPTSLLEELEPEQLRLLKPTKETVNGVDSLRYSIDQADIEALRGLGALLGEGEALEGLPEEFHIDLWLAEDGGWPVRMTMTARGAIDGEEISLDFSLDITDVNDPSIKIEPPQT
jgi:hypothetical protein